MFLVFSLDVLKSAGFGGHWRVFVSDFSPPLPRFLPPRFRFPVCPGGRCVFFPLFFSPQFSQSLNPTSLSAAPYRKFFPQGFPSIFGLGVLRFFQLPPGFKRFLGLLETFMDKPGQCSLCGCDLSRQALHGLCSCRRGAHVFFRFRLRFWWFPPPPFRTRLLLAVHPSAECEYGADLPYPSGCRSFHEGPLEKFHFFSL